MMPTLPTKTRARSRWFMAGALPLVLLSACPQLASDDFTKADTSLDPEGSDDEGSIDTSAGIDLTSGTQETSGGNDNTSSTSAGGTDAVPDTATSASEGDDATSSTETSASTSGSGGSGGSGGSPSTATGGGTGGGSTGGGTGGGSTDGDTTSSGCVPGDEVCDGLDNDCDGEPDQGETCDGNYGCQGFAFKERGYMYCPRPASVDEAEIQCDGQGMTLVQIDSEAENDAMVAQAGAGAGWGGGTGGSDSGTTFGGGTRTNGGEQQQQAFWTGGSDFSEGDWIWTGSGTPFWKGDANGDPVDGAYTNWGDGRPNESNDSPEDCAAVYVADGTDGDIGTWNDLPCEDPYSFICEAP